MPRRRRGVERIFKDTFTYNEILNIIKTNLRNIKYTFIAISLLKRVKILEDTNCWIISKDWSEYSNYNEEGAHRFSYKLFVCDIVDGRYICHKCDRKGCINFNHLFQGTPSDNHKDYINKKTEYEYSRQMDMIIRRGKTGNHQDPKKEIRAWNRYNDYQR